MSWSLQLRNGDLVLGASRYTTVTNEQKLVQDLRCHILEHMGTDDMHPGFGSLLDGGISPDGVVHSGVIGERQSDIARLEIETELRRIVQEHQTKQLNRAKADRLTYGRATLTPNEVLYALDGIEIRPYLDTYYVVMNITTAGGANVSLNLPIGV